MMLRAVLIVCAAAALAVPSAAAACGTRPMRATREQSQQDSNVIVRGALSYRWLPGADEGADLLTGEVTPRVVEKGAAAPAYRVRQSFLNFYCSGFGWEPEHQPVQGAYRGRFYLRRSQDGSYVIVRYEH